MTENKTDMSEVKPLNFRVQLILFFVTATLWEPFYNLFCFMGLNKLSLLPTPDNIPSTKNNIALNILLVVSIFGAPFAYYNRYKLLRDYIEAMDKHLGPLPKEKNEAGEEIEVKRPICIEPKKFVGFVITLIAMILLLAGCFTIVIYYHIQYSTITNPANLWEGGAYMIFLPIGIATFFITFGFSYRVASEEKMWFKAYNSILLEMKNKLK